MRLKRARLDAGTVAILGGGLAAGAMLSGGGASAANDTTTSPVASSSTATSAAPAEPGGPMHEHTEVTGDELAKVTDAVKNYDSTLAVDSVRQDPDGSYDVAATKDSNALMLDVSADLATVTERTGRPGGPGGPGGASAPGGHGLSSNTRVTGNDLINVTAAVTEYDATITVESVRMDPDGSYDVFGTKDDAPVMLEVSADLGTVTENAGGPGDHGGPADALGATAPDGAPPAAPGGSGETPSAYAA